MCTRGHDPAGVNAERRVDATLASGVRAQAWAAGSMGQRCDRGARWQVAGRPSG